MASKYLKKRYLELIDKVAELDMKAALYLATMPSFPKKKRSKLDFEFSSCLENAMIWDETAQGWDYWNDISEALPDQHT